MIQGSPGVSDYKVMETTGFELGIGKRIRVSLINGHGWTSIPILSEYDSTPISQSRSLP
jgi:hypothetical protein